MTIFVARIRHLLGQFSNSWGTPQGLDTLARVLSLANHNNSLGVMGLPSLLSVARLLSVGIDMVP